MTTVPVVCMKCGVVVRLEQSETAAPGSVSHGYCRPCFEKRMEEIRNLPKPQPPPASVAVMLVLLVWLPLVFGGPATSSVACGVAGWPPCGEVRP